MLLGARVLFPHDPATRTLVALHSGGLPKMARLLSASKSTPPTAFYGSFDFIDDQDYFVLVILRRFIWLQCNMVQRRIRIYSLVELRLFLSTCQVFIFCSLVEKQYIGTDEYKSRSIMLGEIARIRQNCILNTFELFLRIVIN